MNKYRVMITNRASGAMDPYEVSAQSFDIEGGSLVFYNWNQKVMAFRDWVRIDRLT